MTSPLYRIIITIGILVTSLLACSSDRELSLPEIRALSNRAEWAVAQDSYVRVHRQADLTSPVIGHFRRGDVVAVIRESAFTDEIDGRYRRWYQVTNDLFDGWVFGTGIVLYDSREQASNASGAMQR
ncbi:MAG: hypothetical protein EA383_09605 [Spirochaetaceae bacterium]|nr:MAG: hypothetical protein EA383_09605 [Spirochaetaceae bacterium]